MAELTLWLLPQTTSKRTMFPAEGATIHASMLAHL